MLIEGLLGLFANSSEAGPGAGCEDKSCISRCELIFAVCRALEEVDKYKRLLAEAKATHAEQLDASRKQLDKVISCL